ncbi:hypothetical protein WMZ97_04760 [Lentibacillus sp. N15]|uniref:hypothetical protein n=1 Tax=Lentibacillus songyuanensis TaxID=3136161 RepID=UPI0031BA3577
MLNKQMIDNLLQAMTDLSDEVKDIQTSGYRLDAHVTDIETRMNHTGDGLNGLQRNLRNIDRDTEMTMDKLLNQRKPIHRKTIN